MRAANTAWVTYGVVVRTDVDGIRKLRDVIDSQGMKLVFDKVTDGYLWLKEATKGDNDGKQNGKCQSF